MPGNIWTHSGHVENSQFEIFQEKGHGLLSSSLKISTRTGAAERNFNFNTQIQYYWTITRWSTQKHRMEAWQSTSFGSNTCRRQGMPISATSARKDLLSHLLVLARVSTIFNVYFTIDTGIPPRQTASPALLLGLTLPSHTLLLLQLRTNIKVPDWDMHFSLAHSPAPATLYFSSLRLWHRRRNSLKCL